MPDWVPGVVAAVCGLGALWLNSRKDKRDAAAGSQASQRATFDLDQDLIAELDKIWRELMRMKRAMFAVSASIRTDADLAIKHGDASAAAAHRADAARIEAALASDD